MAIDAAHAKQDDSETGEGSVALLPEPFKVNAEAVELAAAAARAALRRTSAAITRLRRPALPGHPNVQLDPFLSAALPIKLP